MIPNPCIEVHTSPVDRPLVPARFAEVVIIAQHLATKGLLKPLLSRYVWCVGTSAAINPSIFLRC